MKSNQKHENIKVAEISLRYHSRTKISEAAKVTNSKDSFNILLSRWNLDELQIRESFKIILLNRNNRVKGICTISQGGVSGTVADPKIIFSTALKSLSCGIILAHNHPSGNISPSNADITLTQRMVDAGKLLDISILDHIIIGTTETYYSFADEGRI